MMLHWLCKAVTKRRSSGGRFPLFVLLDDIQLYVATGSYCLQPEPDHATVSTIAPGPTL